MAWTRLPAGIAEVISVGRRKYPLPERVMNEERGKMVKEIVRDPLFLARKSETATAEDLAAAVDLRDTLAAHAEGCVGMAANMIGVLKRIIIFDNEGVPTVMFNPEIVKASEPYTAQEGCLSHDGLRTAKRYKNIKVRYMNEAMQVRLKTYRGFTAQIIQHEIDHCDGVLI